MVRKWTYTKRKINGKMTNVKVRTHMGKVQIRKVGVRNLTDKAMKRINPNTKRIKGYVNETDGYHSTVNHYSPKKKTQKRSKKKTKGLFGIF